MAPASAARQTASKGGLVALGVAFFVVLVIVAIREAVEQIDGHGMWLSAREDLLLSLVERFFKQRIFGPMRMQKLARQLDAHGKRSRKDAKESEARMRRQIADLDDAIGLQIEAIEKGVEPELVGRRIAQLRSDKREVEAAMRTVAAESAEDAEPLAAALKRIPDLSK